ncbi:uncharacterized protein F4812DRAFT_114361 [Daldinia caldariorum]|uniref:uncharacterized protein n=1 Tax=Daldinia caldariorum TaxID=326644 RepID=UPI0020078F9C|nr:uncharacterized protein F4812DRAFT_114361 [Daldinia caldariorum]KAI1465838.1 hypothetical protein F4812DRAFT_114361 [Daldinia caldariorum]
MFTFFFSSFFPFSFSHQVDLKHIWYSVPRCSALYASVATNNPSQVFDPQIFASPVPNIWFLSQGSCRTRKKYLYISADVYLYESFLLNLTIEHPWVHGYTMFFQPSNIPSRTYAGFPLSHSLSSH